jgi:hypothetical protein
MLAPWSGRFHHLQRAPSTGAITVAAADASARADAGRRGAAMRPGAWTATRRVIIIAFPSGRARTCPKIHEQYPTTLF